MLEENVLGFRRQDCEVGNGLTVSVLNLSSPEG
jgi:hypothetical protein